ncbi:hypothetical protein LBMAG42_17600 [Deltaproteobacteria bacterium]|nr:hypothetical protein LBMAG42_17600 [Deltaproteobacteria bacterium]
MDMRAVHVGTANGEGIHWHTTVRGNGEAFFADGHSEWVHDRATFDTEQPDREGLRPPLLEDAWQRVDLVGLEWTPDPKLGFERRVDGWAPRTLGNEERAGLELADPHIGFSTYTFGATALEGEVTGHEGIAASTSLGVAGVFMAIVAGIFVARRVLQRQLRREEADAYMAREFGEGTGRDG